MRERIAVAIDRQALDGNLADDITRAVATIHPEMAWELAPGRSAKHAFCISPEGRADLRQIALRWLASAPAQDGTWEFHASRQPAENLPQLEVAGARFDLAEMRAITSWDSSRFRVDVRLWHPSFERVPPPVRAQVGFLFLDNLLGEDDVERWIGAIEYLDDPISGKTPAELKAEVDRHRVPSSDDDGRWVLGTLNTPAGVSIVAADAGLKRIDHPFADKHVEIAIVLDHGGMPGDEEATRLNAWEDDLVELFDSVAVFAGRTTRPGLRTMHFVAEDLDRVRRVIDAWAESLPPVRVKVGFGEDMNWAFRQQEFGLQ